MNKNRRNTRKAYFQQAENAPMDPNTDNNPNKLGYPGEVAYKNAPMAVPVGEDSRPWEQRWFEGAAAKTKQVMGPKGAEFELKKEWLRILPDAKVANAAISGGFTRNASDAPSSFWTFYMKDASGARKPILRASLKDIWGKNLTEQLANKTASKEYAKEVFKKIREEGFNTVAYLLTGEGKYAQAANGGKGLKKTAQMSYDQELDLGEDVDNGEDVSVALDGEVDATAAEGEVTVELLTQKHEELEAAQTNLVENTAPESTADVFVQLQDAERMVDEAREEMESAVAALRDKTRTASSKIKLIRVVAEAQDDAVSTLSASDSILRKAQFEISEDGAGDMGEEVVIDDMGDDGDMDMDDMGGEAVSGESAVEAADAAIAAASELSDGGETAELGEEAVDVDVDDAGDLGTEVAIEDALASGRPAKSVVAKFLQARAARRKAIASGDDNAAEQGKYQVVPEGAPKDGDAEIASAHPNGGSDVTNLTAGGAPKDNGQRFETVIEAQDVDLAVANKMPTGNLNGQAGDPNSDVGGSAQASAKRKVKTASNDIPGGVDQDTKNFWAKDLWGQAEGDAAAKEFGKLMYQDFGTARASIKAAVAEGLAREVKAAKEEAEAKTERAYALADLAVEKGFIENHVEARSDFVKEVKAYNDEAFLSTKARLEKLTIKSSAAGRVATASAKKIPNVGLLDGSEVSSSKDEFSALDSFGWK